MTRWPLMKTALGVALCALLAALPSAAFAAPAGWTEPTRVTSTTAFGFDELGVSSSLVAMRSTGAAAQMWVWTPGQPTASPLPSLAGGDSLAVSGGRAVWRRALGRLGVIMTWRVGDQTPATFAQDVSRDNDYPAVWGDRIAWLGIGLGDESVLTRKVSLPPTTTVSAMDNAPKFDVGVSGDRVVWYASDGSTWQIFTRVVGETRPTQLTTGSSPNISPQVSGDRVVWMSQDEQGNGVVRTWKKGDAHPTTIDLAAYDGHPRVAGDCVVWTSGTPGDSQVHLWRSGVKTTVTTGPHSASSASISGDRIVWQDQVSGQYQIVTRRVSESSLTTIASSVDVLADPVVGDNRVAWRDFNGASYQVFTASGPPVATSLGKPTASPTTPTHGRTATFRSYLTQGIASFATGAKATLYLYRKESGHWRLRNTVTTSRSSTGTRVLLSASVKPRYAGSWRAIVKFGGAAGYSGATSSTTYFTVR